MRPEAAEGRGGHSRKHLAHATDDLRRAASHRPPAPSRRSIQGQGPKRFRRSKAEITTIKDAIIETLTEDHPQTNRGVFYRAETAGVIEKTDAEYKTTVCRLLKELRLARVIPFGWIADNTRWMRKPRTHDSVEDAGAVLA